MRWLALLLLIGACDREDREVRARRDSAYMINEGQILYSAMNCVGCHSHGAGGMGLPLMDDVWKYGNRPEDIYDSIMDGRPEGMPAFRGLITETDVWKLVAYVRSMSGLVEFDRIPSRDEHMHTTPEVNVEDSP